MKSNNNVASVSIDAEPTEGRNRYIEFCEDKLGIVHIKNCTGSRNLKTMRF